VILAYAILHVDWVVVPGLEREMNRLITGEGKKRNLGPGRRNNLVFNSALNLGAKI
jgi:hypothetical protein